MKRRNKLFYRAPKISLYTRLTGDDTLNKSKPPEEQKMSDREKAKEIVGMICVGVWLIGMICFVPALFP